MRGAQIELSYVSFKVPRWPVWGPGMMSSRAAPRPNTGLIIIDAHSSLPIKQAPFTDEETEVYRYQTTCLRAHKVMNLGPESP